MSELCGECAGGVGLAGAAAAGAWVGGGGDAECDDTDSAELLLDRVAPGAHAITWSEKKKIDVSIYFLNMLMLFLPLQYHSPLIYCLLFIA